MHAIAPAPRINAPIAAYIRAYPADLWLTETHRRALGRLAAQRGLPAPLVFTDNGRRPEDERPGLSALLKLVATGVFRTVLIPGPFVFAVAGTDADAIAARITASGCEIVDLSAAGQRLLHGLGDVVQLRTAVLPGDERADRHRLTCQSVTQVARALATDPELLLFDEITSALDPEPVGEVLDVVTDLKQRGLTILMATHEMGFARHAADRVCFLEDDVIREQGPAEQVLTDPQHESTRRFLARVLDRKKG